MILSGRQGWRVTWTQHRGIKKWKLWRFQRRNLASSALAKWPSLASPVISYLENIYPLTNRVRRAFHLCGLPPWKIYPLSNLEKIINKPNMKSILQNIWSILLQTRNIWMSCHSQEEPKETRQPNVVWCPGWDSGTEKGHEKTQWDLNKV